MIKTTAASNKEQIESGKKRMADTIARIHFEAFENAKQLKWETDQRLNQESLQRTTITQQMAERHAQKTQEMTLPQEYQRHTKVFSEEEATHFPPSREWDHCIPLKPDAPDSINAKLFSLPLKERNAIEDWVYKMLEKGFIQRSDLKYGHSTFMIPKKDGSI